jgi:TPR repeat protein
LLCSGRTDALFYLGVYYLKGKGVAQDEQQGVKYFEMAAAQGHARAQDILIKSFIL